MEATQFVKARVHGVDGEQVLDEAQMRTIDR